MAGWQAFPWQALAVVVASLVTGAVALIGIIINQGNRTRERIDALGASLGARVDRLQADLESTRRDVASLGTRVGTLPAQVVSEEDCRERHDALQSLTLAQGRRLIVTGSGGSE